VVIALVSSVVVAQRSGGWRGGGATQGVAASHGVSGSYSMARASRGGSHYRGGRNYGGSRSYGGGRYGSSGRYYGSRQYRGHSHSSVHLGFVFSSPLWYGPYYPYAYPYYPYSYDPYPYYPPAVVVPQAPQVYIERENADVAREASSPYWYYCRESNLYYPYARECAGQWEQVPAKPQSAER
jgi:hypothetical protein